MHYGKAKTAGASMQPRRGTLPIACIMEVPLVFLRIGDLAFVDRRIQ